MIRKNINSIVQHIIQHNLEKESFKISMNKSTYDGIGLTHPTGRDAIIIMSIAGIKLKVNFDNSLNIGEYKMEKL